MPKVQTRGEGSHAMNKLIRNLRRFDALDADIARWMRATGPVLMRYSIAVVFFWFGLLKVLGISPLC